MTSVECDGCDAVLGEDDVYKCQNKNLCEGCRDDMLEFDSGSYTWEGDEPIDYE